MKSFAKRPSLRATLAIALAIATVGCGGGDHAASNGAPRAAGAECGAADPFGAGTAAERALVEQGRSDAGFYELFGAENAGVFESADDLRSDLMTALAMEEGFDIPSAEEPPDGCTPSGIEAQGFSRTAITALGWTTGALRDAINAAPLKIESSIGPRTQSDTYSSASGDPIHVSITTGVVLSGHDSTVQVVTTTSATIVAGDVTSVETATLTASMNVCPDADGLAVGSLEGTFDGAGTDGSSYRGVVKDDFYVVVDDGAHATLTNHVYSAEYHATGAAAADVAAHGTATNTPFGLKGGSTLDQSDGSEASRKLVQNNLPFFAFAPAINVQSDAESKWRGGTCVEVHADPQSPENGALDASPGESVSVTATPFQKFEKADLDAPVIATLSGKASVDPANEAIASPASFEYVAGDECKDKGSVNFKSTSKRGIGRGSTSFVTKADPDMKCPEGEQVNPDTCQCECKAEKSCPSGQSWDATSCKCACSPKKCPSGQSWDTTSCACVCSQDCPSGETLNVAQCRCEASCELDVTGQVPLECKWSGTIHVSSSASGGFTPFDGRTVTWQLEYDGTYELDDDAYLTLSGPVNHRYKEVTTDTAAPGGCSSTLTYDESLSTDFDHVGTIGILLTSGGRALLSVNLPDAPTGTQTTEHFGGKDCPPKEVLDSEGLTSPPLDVMITVSGSSSKGSTDDACALTGVYRTFPDDSQAPFAMSWDLTLVHR